ncbi:cold-shock protein [Nocardioides sp. Kera G14]|uniref:cold-shock protein n=1 Tax=Nocardioides sp. Kera G14 TaxID=2884264 RepID=UPI001D126FAA|nr:cold-shock protein [Nocardioides sp. Kera G14]UDY24226.1 cold-shock protein [Nocardioides sp. Kera G14]
MPTGKVKWFSAEKGFGFIAQEDGTEVYVHADALQPGADKLLKGGTRVEFEVYQGRKGAQAGHVKVLDSAPSVSRNLANAKRRKPEEMEIIVENVIKLLDDIREGYAHGRPPTKDLGKKIAPALRNLADEFEL